MFPPRFQPFLFAFFMSGMMSFLIIGISTLRLMGFVDGFFGLWISGWLSAWVVAYPIVLFVAPLARKITMRLVRQPV
ncbi:MAG: DUF2798 domain-containing protein [Rhodobacteraceae bacterium]|nr:DUF2798 domain-containing protein [Paracoccaceae bacterium]